MTKSERLPRKLAAVLYADVAGYSRLTAEDEDTTHRRLSAHLDLVAANVKRHGGRVMHYAGDAVLAKFGAAVDAVTCAADLQRELAVRNSGLQEDQRVEFRIGVNLGDVIEDRGDIYGDGVNVAARLEALAGAGEICVSESVRIAVGKRLPLDFEDLGEQPLKNIDHPVRAYRIRVPPETTDVDQASAPPAERTARVAGRRLNFVVATVLVFVVISLAAGAYFFTGGSPSDSVPGQTTVETVSNKSVAVLPFADLSEGGDRTWLVDGLTEEILNSLAQLPELQVTARTSSFQFRGQDRDITEIAEMLGVAHVVEGSVRVIGDRLRVTAQLIRARDGFHIWSSTYDRATGDLFEVQRDVAERIASALNVVLDDSRRAAMSASGTRNVEAFEAYQKGWAVYNVVHGTRTNQTLWDANAYFERAMELDPTYAQAAVGRMDAFVHQLTNGPVGFVANSPYSQEEALILLRENLDFAAANSTTPTMRLATEIIRETFSPTWQRMPVLLTRLRQEWDVNSITLSGGVDNALWLPNILLVAGHHDLVRELAEQHVTRDPLSVDAWLRRLEVELHTGDFDAAREVLSRSHGTLGPALQGMEFFPDLLEGRRNDVIEFLSRFDDLPGPGMFLAAVRGDYQTAMRMAEERERALERELEGSPLQVQGWLLSTYYETGAADRAERIVKRIDELPAGSAIFIRLLSGGGNALFFELEDAPKFAANLDQAGIDPATFRRRPRLSTME